MKKTSDGPKRLRLLGAIVNNVKVSHAVFHKVLYGIGYIGYFEEIVQAPNSNWNNSGKQKGKMENLTPLFKIENEDCLYNEKLSVLNEAERHGSVLLDIARHIQAGD